MILKSNETIHTCLHERRIASLLEKKKERGNVVLFFMRNVITHHPKEKWARLHNRYNI